MTIDIPRAEQLFPELEFSASRSSGPGGQNVNKVNSKITLRWDVVHSQLLLPDQKEKVLQKLSHQLTKEGILMLTSQEKRSQLENKQEAVFKLNKLLISAFTIRKPRKKTKPSKSSKNARIKEKKQHSEKKQWRQKV
jgi:ribosome-associated protein